MVRNPAGATALEISAGCGIGQRPLKSPQSSVKSLVWWLILRGGAGGVRISSGVGGHEDPFHHLGLLMPHITEKETQKKEEFLFSTVLFSSTTPE